MSTESTKVDLPARQPGNTDLFIAPVGFGARLMLQRIGRYLVCAENDATQAMQTAQSQARPHPP